MKPWSDPATTATPQMEVDSDLAKRIDMLSHRITKSQRQTPSMVEFRPQCTEILLKYEHIFIEQP